MAASPARIPICEVTAPQRAHEKTLAADLRARANGLEHHPDQKEVQSVLRNHLECLTNGSREVARMCAGLKQRENEKNEIPPLNASSDSAPARCEYYGAVSGIEATKWHEGNQLLLLLEKLPEVYKTCSAIANKYLRDLGPAAEGTPHAAAIRQAIVKVGEFPATVRLISPELRTEMERRDASLETLEKSHQDLMQRLAECKQRNEIVIPMRRVR